MKKAQFFRTLTAATLSSVLLISNIALAFAADLSPTYTYKGGGITFEKISHPESATESADGVVDYIGNGAVAPYVSGESALGQGDRGQSYSYASASYGDWVYINTMYGGLGANAILNIGFGDLTPDAAQAMIAAMYNGHMYTGEPDGKSAGGILFKFNVKTGETKLLMSKTTNGLMPTFRSAIKMNGKLYFVGMIMDVNNPELTPQEINYAIAVQNGFPCVYEVDPENDDKLTCIYNCVDTAGFRKLVNDNVFTSTRAIGTYEDAMIAGCLDTNGVFLTASKDPSAGQDSFKVIANMNDLFNYPAYHRSDVNGGGGIYQVLEYNGALYVVICTGTEDSKNEHGTLKTFAIVKGTCNGDVTDKSSWSWSVLAGDPADGAKYPFGLDSERYSAGACTLQVYNDYLYIGDYNDVSSALQGFILKKDFTTQATNLEQSINLYRMDKNENIEKVVGDPTEAFPTSLTGLGSGYTSSSALKKLGTHMNQYTWQTTVYNGKLYVGTMDTTTLLEPIAQLTNGDLIKMTPEQWKSQLNYIRVLLELLFKKPVEKDITNNSDFQNSVPVDDGTTTEDALDAGNTDTAESTDAEDAALTTEALDASDSSNDTADNAAASIAVQASDDTSNAVSDSEAAEDSTEDSVVSETPVAEGQASEETVLDETSAKALVQEAVQAAQSRVNTTSPATYAAFSLEDQASDTITLSDEQTNELVNGLLDGSIASGMIDEELMGNLIQVNDILSAMSSLINTTDVEEFATAYDALIGVIDSLGDLIPENIKALYKLILSYATRDNLSGFLSSLQYLRTSESGFDLFEITDKGTSGVKITAVTTDGFGDRYNHGLRIFENTSDYWVIGTANPFNGTQLWRTKTLEPIKPVDPVDPVEPVTPVNPVTPITPLNPVTPSNPLTPVISGKLKSSALTPAKASAVKSVTASKTGDTSNPIVLFAIAGGALVVILGAVVVLRKKKH